MPHGFEYVVRPFQTPGSLGNVVIPGTPGRTEDKAHITWGGVGTMPSVKMLYPSTVVNTKKEDLDEQNRDSETQRIIGSDGESYVDVDRAKTVRLNKEETDENQSLGYNFYAAQDPKLDPKMDPYLKNFRSPQQNQKKSGPIKVTWNLKNP